MSVESNNHPDKNEKTSSSSSKDGLTLLEKLSFAIVGMPFQMVFTALGIFSTVFLLDVAKLPPEKNVYKKQFSIFKARSPKLSRQVNK
jgi:hypothetical protein